MPSFSMLQVKALALMAAGASALTTSAAATYNGCQYSVPSVGSFNDFVNVSFASTGALTKDFQISTYTVAAGTAPFARQFSTSNVNFANGAMNLVVPGAQLANPLTGAQVTTAYSDILYGSVRTVASFSAVPGTTHGFTFYMNDTQETDINYVTYNPGMIVYTNQQTSPLNSWTTYPGVSPADGVATYHEYRTDWTPAGTAFYIDGVLQRMITGNIPSNPGLWLWNNWSNGDTFTHGPPVADNILSIQSITMYFNRTSDSTAACTPSTNTATTAKATTTTLANLVNTLLPTAATTVGIL